MANTIRIKRSSTSAAPTGLTQGELAYSESTGTGDGELFIGIAGASQEVVGGWKYVAKLNGIEAGADVTDAASVDAAGAVMNSDTSSAAVGFVIDEDSFATDSASKVPTQQSVKAYVTAQVAGAVTSGMAYKGDYNASTDTPNLDSTPIATVTGDTYTVTVAGTFFTADVEIGDTLISQVDNAAAETDWTIVQANLTPASIKTQYESNADTNALTDASVTKLGNTSGTNSGDEVQATQTVAGIAELATQVEVDAGSDDLRIVTPLRLNAWVIDGGTF